MSIQMINQCSRYTNIAKIEKKTVSVCHVAFTDAMSFSICQEYHLQHY